MAQKYGPKDWMKAGGMLGLAVLAARATRTPLATIVSAMPFLLESMKRLENNQAQQGSAAMTKEEAALILGVAVTADAGDIQAAHRRLIQKNHPDAGGTDYLAAKINQARDLLLKP